MSLTDFFTLDRINGLFFFVLEIENIVLCDPVLIKYWFFEKDFSCGSRILLEVYVNS